MEPMRGNKVHRAVPPPTIIKTMPRILISINRSFLFNARVDVEMCAV
tara:strand:+ start:168 stop:308 length:141 start_codon:yes stop_codon:yes gene_type:complete